MPKKLEQVWYFQIRYFQGLDDLDVRCRQYKADGCQFAKWRSVLKWVMSISTNQISSFRNCRPKKAYFGGQNWPKLKWHTLTIDCTIEMTPLPCTGLGRTPQAHLPLQRMPTCWLGWSMSSLSSLSKLSPSSLSSLSPSSLLLSILFWQYIHSL